MSKIAGFFVFVVGLIIGIADIIYHWGNLTSVPPDISGIWLWVFALIGGFVMFIGAMIMRQ